MGETFLEYNSLHKRGDPDPANIDETSAFLEGQGEIRVIRTPIRHTLSPLLTYLLNPLDPPSKASLTPGVPKLAGKAYCAIWGV